MKTFRVCFGVLAVALLFLLAGGTPQAFHSGGVAECGGCHSMHNPAPNGSFLLVGTDPSSTCLSCHMPRPTPTCRLACRRCSGGPAVTSGG
ncbi:MAG: cytochrome [Acidobacteria bacterium]|nr:cytochrome [Acidobacteriota bacterium]